MEFLWAVTSLTLGFIGVFIIALCGHVLFDNNDVDGVALGFLVAAGLALSYFIFTLGG